MLHGIDLWSPSSILFVCLFLKIVAFPHFKSNLTLYVLGTGSFSFVCQGTRDSEETFLVFELSIHLSYGLKSFYYQSNHSKVEANVFKSTLPNAQRPQLLHHSFFAATFIAGCFRLRPLKNAFEIGCILKASKKLIFFRFKAVNANS